MTEPLRLGIAGLGTVGAGVVRIVQTHAAMLEARGGRPVSISAVCARSRNRDRGVDVSGYDWEDDPVALARRDDVDVLIELMGGEDGPAKACVEAALETGKHVVTANKAMLAHHGQAMAEAAEAAGRALKFEAAVAGGIPIVKALGEGLAANAIQRLMGVMNGTCNYILTEMEATEAPYEQVLEDAQKLGYAEADPTFDVGGIDAAHKLALLASIAYGARVDFAGVQTEGIDRITLTDIQQARDMGFRIKLLGVAKMTPDGLEQRMTPCLVPAGSSIGLLGGVTNAVVVEGDFVGQTVFQGPGAGQGPTASAVMADVLDIARGQIGTTFGVPATRLAAAPRAADSGAAAYYLRMSLQDAPGTLAKVTAALGEEGVSIRQMRQYEHEGDAAPVIFVTHPAPRAALDGALGRLGAMEECIDAPMALRVEIL
ncbi:homoserine dehydrogenase [Albimonas sp. CAU 1670]|uniref:homoserine dehydrogenase n=1 Tax=Albimonas sp. CAU 1670 TaxID=3032599 RepID=UPI0023DA8CEE|nr:homoserine dehydrogenase [Albimonas sp. CAU 1670]MDF2232270.1 homoserine dehydrogenase [Albimonas sp. CAU 1670]